MKKCYSCFKGYEDMLSVCPFCGHPEIKEPKEPIYLKPGTILAQRYLIGESVGAGGFGIVYKAWDMKLETVVAVKEFFASRLVSRAAGETEVIVNRKSVEEFRYRKDRFLAEARNMAKFGSHRSIPNVFEFFEENNTAYIVMELLTGLTLNEYIVQNGGKMDVDFAVYIANEVATALKSLHAQKIIHRDVAPDNIFVCSGKDIRIKLMDFGAAKLEDSTDQVIDIVLKPGYSPVEQYDNSKNIGPWTDIYALGATLYMMVTGVKPDEATNRKIFDEVQPPKELQPEISENLSNAIMKAMAIERHMRFKTVADFTAAINGKRKTVTLKKERRRKRIRWISGIAAACAALTVGAALCAHMYQYKKSEAVLKAAEIDVWFSTEEGSREQKAMESVRENFQNEFPEVKLNLRGIPQEKYLEELEKAAANGTLPDLFESTGVPENVLSKCKNVDPILKTEQFKNCLFLNQYRQFYQDTRRIPLAIEIPMAYVITRGASSISYTEPYFENLKDFGSDVSISGDERYQALTERNFGKNSLSPMSDFMNNEKNSSPVLLSSTMAMNEVRTTLTNYQKQYVYYYADKIYCNFTYEWSICPDGKAENAAAQRLLSWMLGNVYQTTLMITECSDGQIPVNPLCFRAKIEARNLQPIADIYEQFVFERGEEAR